MTGEHVLAIDQLRSTVAALEGDREREAAVATFFADYALPVVEGDLCTFCHPCRGGFALSAASRQSMAG